MANSAEAQAWVSIGTNLPAKTKGVEKVEEVTIIKQEKDDDVGSEKQLHLDEDALQLEPFASDDFVAGDKFEQEVAENGHETNEEPVSGVGEKQNKEKERERNSNSAKDDEDVGHQTNSNNPQLVRCRIFVGHLNTDKCSRKDVEDLFAPFGKVLACSLQQGYGFVQYETEQSARKAIRELHGVNFFGMKLVVDKTAAQKKSDGEDPRARKPWPGEKEYTTEGLRNRRRNSDRQEGSRQGDYDYRQERYSASSRDPYYSSQHHDPYDRATYDRRYERAYESRTYERGGYDRGSYERSSSYERYPVEKVSADRYDAYPTSSSSSSSKPAIHDRDYYAARDPYRSLSDRRWEERAAAYDQYADYYARARADDYPMREDPYYSVRDDPYNPPRSDPYERRPYDRYAATSTYDRRY